MRIQELAHTQSMTTLIRPRLGGDARLVVGNIDIGGALVRTDIEVHLDAAGASTEMFGLAMAGAGRHIDNHVCADHSAPDTRSRQTYRSIVDNGGRVVFNGKVVVRPDAQRIDADQRSDNLLLAKNAEVDTKPELEIYADDVRCSHGATVGELDESELFYLQSRGIPAETARELLTFGFANRVLADIRDEALRRHIGGRISSIFGSSLTMGDALLMATEASS
jgi:Fe-S cluster assembly protein SufD